VALLGAHSVGHTHKEISGMPFYQWDTTPDTFDNIYYQFLVNQAWQYDEDGMCDGVSCRFYFNRSWIMLLTDIMLRDEGALRLIVQEYADDEAKWHADFAAAFKTITELGLPDVMRENRLRVVKAGCPFANSGKPCPH